MIEDNKVNEKSVKSVIAKCIKQGADTIVLGCTHYHWIKDLITDIAGEDVTVLEPSDAIGRRVKELLKL